MANLTGRQLDAAVAERVMGCSVKSRAAWPDGKPLTHGVLAYKLHDRDGNEMPPHHSSVFGWGWGTSEDEAWSMVPSYSTSCDAVATVRAEIERRGLQNHFCSILDDMTNDDPGMLIDAWAFLNATPEQQCRAALKAVEGTHA